MPDTEFTDRRATSELGDEVAGAVRAILQDKDLIREFWETGFTELSRHTRNEASMWIGKRIMTWLVGVITLAGIGWLIRSGAIK